MHSYVKGHPSFCISDMVQRYARLAGSALLVSEAELGPEVADALAAATALGITPEESRP